MKTELNGTTLKCKVCGDSFNTHEYRKNIAKYCSKECWRVRGRVVNSCLDCGKEVVTYKSVNKKYCGNECRNKHYRQRFTGENSHQWKGDSASYSAIHKWVTKNYEAKGKCEQCKSDRYVDLANKSGEYKRERSDWMRLCRSCHFYYDGRDKVFKRY